MLFLVLGRVLLQLVLELSREESGDNGRHVTRGKVAKTEKQAVDNPKL